MTPAEEESFLSSVGSGTVSGLSAIGNLLDVPGSMVRDVLAWENPLDQLLSPFSGENRVGGRDLLERYGMLDPNMPGLDFGDVLGFGAEVVADPLSYMTLGASAVTKGGQAARNAGHLDDLLKLAAPGVGRRAARMQTSLSDLLSHADDVQLEDIGRAAEGMGFETLDALRAAHGSEPVGGLAGFGVPFMDPVTTFGTGKIPQAIAGAMDKAGEVLRYGKIPGTDFSPGMFGAQIMDTSVRGLGTVFGQKTLGPASSAIEHMADVEARYAFAPAIKAFDDIVNKLPTPDHKMDAFRALRRSMETGKPLPNHLAPMQQFLPVYKQIMQELRGAESAAGLMSEELEDMVDYVTRRMHFWDEKQAAQHGYSNKIVSGEHKSQIRRREFLRGLEGGSELINRLSLDPDLSGVFHNKAPSELTKGALDAQERLLNKKLRRMGISDDSYNFLKGQVERVRSGQKLMLTDEMLSVAADEGLDAAKVQRLVESQRLRQAVTDAGFDPEKLKRYSQSADPAIRQKYLDAQNALGGVDLKKITNGDEAKILLGMLQKEAKKTTNQMFEHSRELANWLANLDPRYVTEKTPVFPNNPLQEAVLRVKIGKRAIGLANLLREQAHKRGTFSKGVAPPGAVRLKDLMADAGMDAEKSLDIFRKKYEGIPVEEVREKIGRYREYQGGMGSAREAALAESSRAGARLSEIVEQVSKARSEAELQRQIAELGYNPNDLKGAVDTVFNSKMEQWQDPVRKGIRQWRQQYKHLIPKARKDVDPDTIAKYFDTVVNEYRNLTGNPFADEQEALDALKSADPKPKISDPAIKSEAEAMLREQQRQAEPDWIYDTIPLGENEVFDFGDDVVDQVEKAAPPEWVDINGRKLSELEEMGDIDEDLAAALKDPDLGPEAQQLLGRMEELGAPYSEFRREYKRLPSESAREAAVDTKEKLEDVWVDGEFAADMKAVIESFRNPSYIEDFFGKIIDPFNRLWQASVTRMFPSFHFRNFLAGMVQNKVAGGFSFRSLSDAHNLIQGKETSSLLKIPHFKGMTEPQARAELSRLIFSENLIDKSQGLGLDAAEGTMLNREMAGQIPGQRPHSISQNLDKWRPRFRDAEGNLTFQEINPLNVDQFVGYQWGTDTGSYIEGLNRVTPFIEYMRKGMSPKEAARRVRASQFDYKDLTKTEKALFRRIIPFWTFSKNQAKFTFDELSQRPGGLLSQLGIRAPNEAREQGQPMPEYLSQTAAIGLGRLPGGADRYLTGLGMSHEDPLSFLSVRGGVPDVSDTISELLSRTSPLVKFPIEYATGESFFQRGPLGGRELQDMDPTLGRLLTNVGLRDELPGGRAKPVVSSNFENLVANLPLARAFTTARSLTDERKWEGTVPGAAAATNFLTGFRISDLSPAAREAILRDEASAQMKEMGAKTWEQVIFNKQQVQEAAKDNPDLAREMIQFNRLQRYLAQQSKARKKDRDSKPD